MSGTVGPRIPPFINTYSLDFDGVSDKLLFSSSNWGADSFSISMWINPSVLSGYRMLLGGSGYSVGTGLGHYIFGNTVKTWVSTGGFAQNLFTTSAVLSIGTWCHIVLVRNKNVSWDLYINGILTKQSYIRLTEDYTSDESLIARHYNNNSFNYGGKIDEVSIFNYGLLPTEVSDIYNLGTPKNLTSLNPIAWYRMGDNGAYKDPQWLIPNNENKDKVSNYSMDFDGMDDYIELGRISHLQNTTQYSISSWFKGALNNLYQAVYAWFDGADGYLQLLLINDGSFWVYNYRTSTAYGVTAPGIVSADTWYNALVVFDGSGVTNADRLKLYINGNLITFASFVGTIPTQTGTMLINGMQIGSQQGGLLFEGNIDEVSIFDSAISIGDVWDGSGKPTDVSAVSGLANYYKMGEDATFSGGVWTVPDAVGSNDGTSVNMTIEDRVGTAPSSSNNALSFNMDLIDRVEDTPQI